MSDRIAVMNNGVIEQIGEGKVVYDAPKTAFVASFVGENNPFPGRVSKADGSGAVIDTAFGPLRGRNPMGVKAGDRAILFVRPEALRLGQGRPDATIASTVLSVAFEGNASHIFLKGAAKKDITLTVGRLERVSIPEQGVEANVTYEPDLGLVLPEGNMARE
jgi:spermidine/putrescine transport system ATP-binding protein